MPSARASRRGAFLNWRFAVNGIQKAARSRSELNSARLFMEVTLHCPSEKKKCRHHAFARGHDVGLRRARPSAGRVPVARRLPARLGRSTTVPAGARRSLRTFVLLRAITLRVQLPRWPTQAKRQRDGRGEDEPAGEPRRFRDRKSTRLNSSHEWISR